jgi:ubiquinone/menaquinone biosynthesis C-methylase UbiE
MPCIRLTPKIHYATPAGGKQNSHGGSPAPWAPPAEEQVLANHARLLERNAIHRRFGYDSAAAVEFVLAKALPLRGHVLDIGTGKGRFVVALARHVPEVTTVDISADEQHFARLEATYAGVANRMDFVLADARSLPWRTGSFDAATSWNVFHHLDDPERVFGEMLRVLKPGGELVLADFSPSGFRLMDEIHAAEGRRHPHPPSQFAHWRARLQNQGFQARRFLDHHEEVLVARHRTNGP